MKKLIIACLMLAATCAEAGTNTLTIRNDRGGVLYEYAIKAATAKLEKRKIVFAGRCDSACTLYLQVDACVTRRASFGFHLPYGAGPKGNAQAAAYMIRSYPRWVREWIRSVGGLTRSIKRMDYAYASRHIPTC